ncbi:c2H2-type domain-containing protein [Trichonephila clavipes]|nr:c2H2-type domain-containing protein [Trichonephila clavipes]
MAGMLRVQAKDPPCRGTMHIKSVEFKRHPIGVVVRRGELDEGFEKWKKEEEIRTKSFFVKRGGAKKVTNKQFTYYMCQRSSITIIKSERKCHEKIGVSIKCGKTCPAFMTFIRKQQQEAIKITVEYQSVHAGHEMEVGRLNLHGNDRRDLAALLKARVPSTKIIEDETVLHTEDSISVDLQVKKMLRGSYNPVLEYKPDGSALKNNPLIKNRISFSA